MMLQFQDEAEKHARLVRMRRFATGLLVISGITLLVAQYLEQRFAWAGFLHAAAEAALIGGIADWFAVTALFRYPLGLRIPHTAIVPNRKDRIGKSLGGFVEKNFLSPEILSPKLASIGVGRRLAQWLQRPESVERVVQHASNAIGALVRSLDDREVEALIERQLVRRLTEIEVTPFASDLLSHFLAAERRQELLDGTLGLIDKLLEENREDLRERVGREIPWWVPPPIDKKIFLKLYTSTEEALHEVRSTPAHPLRQRFNELVDVFLERLKSSPEVIAKGEAFKEEFLRGPEINLLAVRLWSDVKAALLQRPRGEGDLKGVKDAIVDFGKSLEEDEALLATVDGWVENIVIRAAQEYRHEAALLIESTVAKWDPDETSRKIELQVGRDLQFIRINGTLVGGLVGLIIYTIRYFS